MKKVLIYMRLVAIILLSAFLLYWGFSIIKCEHMTHMYGKQFEEVYAEYTMFMPPDYHKVINYTGTTAKVYYVSRGSGGDVVYYKRDNVNSEWTFAKWVTVWSDSGSADDFLWPYIR